MILIMNIYNLANTALCVAELLLLVSAHQKMSKA